ncbi:hypothetical protein [Halomarina litorea]|uniref:hypothetical protein n=1 Tax=Halomarina litorea TaxID=2961595 RepID=UPI0020C28970|nr:hypothetical protein [Halomarina sp. BCD28]
MSEHETVWIAVGGRSNSAQRSYHTDPNCSGLKSAKRVAEKPRVTLSARTKHCRLCSGDYRPHAAGDGRKMQKRLLESKPEDLGLSSLSEDSA